MLNVTAVTNPTCTEIPGSFKGLLLSLMYVYVCFYLSVHIHGSNHGWINPPEKFASILKMHTFSCHYSL
jgi:hypothetical protein